MDSNKTDLIVKINVDTTDIDKATEKVKNLIALTEKANSLSAGRKVYQEKLDWLKSIGAKKFEHPMTWDDGHNLYSDEYLAETPLKALKARHID